MRNLFLFCLWGVWVGSFLWDTFLNTFCILIQCNKCTSLYGGFMRWNLLLHRFRRGFHFDCCLWIRFSRMVALVLLLFPCLYFLFQISKSLLLVWDLLRFLGSLTIRQVGLGRILGRWFVGLQIFIFFFLTDTLSGLFLLLNHDDFSFGSLCLSVLFLLF